MAVTGESPRRPREVRLYLLGFALFLVIRTVAAGLAAEAGMFFLLLGDPLGLLPGALAVFLWRGALWFRWRRFGGRRPRLTSDEQLALNGYGTMRELIDKTPRMRRSG